MKKTEIKVNGEAYPCRPTMGAMLRFKRETGKEVTEIRETSELIIYLWCCVVSASNADGKSFALSLQDFADNVPLDEMASWADEVLEKSGGAVGEGEKKSR